MHLETVIGLEVHVQLKTKSKMFCRCDNHDEQEPNSAICPICTGQPGALPLPNAQAIDWAVMASLALGCTINQESKFDRKSYFYPDLPKGYQISQFDKPFGTNGNVKIAVNGEQKTFRIHRLHLEEDAGKLIHSGSTTLVDLNRAGTPLMEIVSEPDFRSPQEAKAYMQELRLIMRYLGISDADMEKGHLRCDANISLRPVGKTELYPKTEIKNINSFKAVERALMYEVERQKGLWEDGHQPTTLATRGWDENLQLTVEQRTKEEAADYRYFPEPDLPPIVISDEHILELKGMISELPAARRERLQSMYKLKAEQSNALVEDKQLVEYFEEVVSEFREYAEAELGDDKASAMWELQKEKHTLMIANWLLNKLSTELRIKKGLAPAKKTANIIWLLSNSKINSLVSVGVYEFVMQTNSSVSDAIKEKGGEQLSDVKELEQIVAGVLIKNEKVIAEVKTGKTAALQFLVGQVMKATKGKANPKVAQEVLIRLLG